MIWLVGKHELFSLMGILYITLFIFLESTLQQVFSSEESVKYQIKLAKQFQMA